MKLKTMKLKIIKYKPITAKPLKYNLIDVKPIFDNTQDWDKDGVINRKDCMPLDPNKHGLLSSYWKRHKALKEAQDMSKLDYTPNEHTEDDINERLSRAETSIQHFKGQVADKTEQYGENIKEGFKDTGKNINRFAKNYSQRAESAQSNPHMRKSVFQNTNKSPLIDNDESRMHRGYQRGVTFNVPGFKGKMYGDSSIPDMSYKQPISRYEAFHPKMVGKQGPFVPKNAPLPRFLIIRKLRRLIVYYQETNQKQKLAELLQQLQGEK